MPQPFSEFAFLSFANLHTGESVGCCIVKGKDPQEAHANCKRFDLLPKLCTSEMGYGVMSDEFDSLEMELNKFYPAAKMMAMGFEQYSGPPTFIVTIAGSERHDGEKPYTYVIRTDDSSEAVSFVIEHFKKETEQTDIKVVSVKAGVPADDCGYTWNDLRDTIKTYHDIDDKFVHFYPNRFKERVG